MVGTVGINTQAHKFPHTDGSGGTEYGLNFAKINPDTLLLR